MSELRRDLRKRIYNRLVLWHTDSLSLYEMGELHPQEAIDDIYTVMLNCILTISQAMDMDADKLCYIIRKAYADREANSRQSQG